MLWPSRDLQSSSRSKDSAGRSTSLSRRRRGSRLVDRRNAPPLSLESLEGRALLAADASLNAQGVLVISLDAADDIVDLTSDGTKYSVAGTGLSSKEFLIASVTGGISVTGSADLNQGFTFKGATTLAQSLSVASSVERTSLQQRIAITAATTGISIGSDSITIDTDEITTTGAQVYSGAVTLEQSITLDAGAGAIRFNGTVEGSVELTLKTTGITTLGDNVGSATPLLSLTTSAGGSTSVASSVKTSGAQSYGDAVSLAAAAVTLEGSVGAFAQGVIGNNRDLVLEFSQHETIDGATWSNLSSLTTDNAGTTKVRGTVITNAGQTYGAALVLLGDTTIDVGADATFAGTVNGSFGLTVNSPGKTDFRGAVGNVAGQALSGVTTDAGGSTSITGGSVKTSGNQVYNDNVTLSAATILTGAAPIFAGTLDAGGENLTLQFSGVTAIGSNFLNLASLTTDAAGSTVLSGTITASGVQTYNDPVTLNGSTTLAGTGFVVFNAAVNGTQSLNVTVAGGTTLAANVTTAGNQAYTKSITLAADVTLAGAIPTFTDGVTGANNSLTLNFTGTTVIDGATFAGIKNLATSNGGTTSLTGTISTTGTQTYGDAVTLAGDTTLESTTDEDIAFTSTVNGGNTLTVNTAGATVFGAAVGGTSAVTSLSTNIGGTTSLGGSVTTSGTQNFRDDVTLTANVVATSIGNLDIGFSGTIDGARSLTVNTTGLTTFGDAVGGVDPLASLTTNADGGTKVTGSVFTDGAQSFGDAVTVLTNGTFFDSASVTFAEGVNATGLDISLTASSGAITSSVQPIVADELTLVVAGGVNAKTTVTKLDVTLTGGNLVIRETDGITLGNLTGITTASGNAQVNAGGAIFVGRGIDAGTGTVALTANGGISGSAGVTASSLTLTNSELTVGDATGITLGTLAVDALRVVQNASGVVTLTNNGDLDLGVVARGNASITLIGGAATFKSASDVAAGATLTVNAPLGIGQTALGAIGGAGTLALRTGLGGGSVLLTENGNTVGSINAVTNGGDVAYIASDAVVIGDVRSVGGNVTFNGRAAGSITFDGAIDARTGAVTISTLTGTSISASNKGTISTSGSGGTVTLTTTTGGSIVAPEIRAVGGAVTLTTGSGGSITAVDISAQTGAVRLQTGAGGAIDTTGGAIQTTSGAISLLSGAGGDVTTAGVLALSGAILVQAGGSGGIDTTAGVVTATSGTVTLSTGGSGSVTTDDVSTTTGAILIQTGTNGSIDSTDGLVSTSGASITMTARGTGAIAAGGIDSLGGTIRLEAGSTGANAIALQGNLSANTTGRITLASSGGIDDDVATSKVTAGQLVVERANGLVTLTAANNSIGALDLQNSSASGNNIVSGSPNLQIGVAGLATNPGITTASGNVSIAVGGGNNITGLSNAVITLGSGVLTLEALRITLNQQAHNVAFIAGNFATLDIKTAGTLTVASGTRAAGEAIAGLRANGVAGGGGLIKITSGGGVGQENDAWIESQPIGLLSITATGAIDLPHPNNKVSNAFFSTPSDITYSDADALVINGINGNTSTKAADSIISAGGAITQSGAILSDNLRAGTTQGSIALTNSGNNVDAFSGQSGPSPDPFPVGVSFTDADDLTIGWAWGVGDFGITAGLDEVVDGEVISRRGFINISVGGSIFIIDELFYDTATAGSLVLRHGSGGSTDYVVSSPVDDGPRTLRQRIDYLNDNAVISPQNELITFNIDQFFPIAIVNALPTIERKVTIGPASVADPDLRIAIDGSGAADGTDGLTFGYGNAQGLGSNGSLIQGLVVYGFAGSGIVLHSSGNTVTNCWVGITRGSEVIANGVGIDIESTTGVGETKLASSNTITGNVVSGNEGAGIRLRNQATLNTITNNLIGTNAYGTVPIGNGGYGIEIIGSNLNAIGGVGQGNTIVNNAGGIKISGKLSSGADFLANTVFGNTIGNNTGDGILIDTSLGNVIGSSGAGNTIQDNVGAGIAITAARATSLAAGNVVQANTITLNDKGGIVLENTAFQTISAGNVVTSNGIFATNTGAGIEVRSTAANSRASDNLIVGNFIGTESGAATDGGNAGAGILLVGAVNTVVGTATAGDGNVVSFNRRDGIRITDGVDATPEVPVTLVATQNRIRGNTVRFNSGLGADDIAGITISGGTQNIVGGTNPGEGNVISDNKAHGVFISGAANESYTDGNRVAGNTINANELDGVVISKSTYQSVEGGNVITANDRDGVSLSEGSTFSRVLGNRIGISADGLVAGNARDGVRVDASTDVVIGSSSAANRNVIAGNGVGADGGAGIFVTNGSNGVVIRNNLIGLDANGGSAGNVDAGIHVVGTEEDTITGVVIGGTATTEGNTISANGLAGLVLESTSGAIVRGNRIGTDIAGGLAIANSGSGIEIVAGENNVVGGTAATAANVISGNTSSGVSIDGGTGHSILGNRIGTNAAGTIAVANLAHGIAVEGVDTTVTIGGTASGSANTIAGNAIDGIHVADGQAAIFANYIGTNAASASTLGNQGDGIEVRGGEGTTIGDGKVSGRNVIAGNDGRGILLSGGSKAAIQGNFVGTNASGTAALANGTAAAPQAGIRIEGANGSSITLGNVVSGNSGNGIELVGTGTLGTVVTGNRVGTTASGAGAIANGAAGIALMSAGAADVDGDPAVDNRNRIGGFVAGDGNLISGNASHGIGITGSTNALVAQNTIGLGLSGAALGNVGSGVSITGSTDIDVTYRNRIAANAGHGVLVTGGSGNSIGADADQISKGLANGNTITSNKLDGVRIDGGATSTVVAANTIGGIGQGNAGRGITVLASSGNTIGGTADKVANGNLIVGNSSDGVGILNTPAANSLLGNTIRLNVGRGILVDNSDAQAIGGVEPGAGNTVVLNKVHGIELRNDADANTIRNNFIGTTSAFAGGLGNSGAGIRIAGGLSQNNSVESNRVQGNVLGGVVLDGAVGNAIGGTNTEENFFGNTIVLNTSAGIAILGNASLNTVSGNRIGTDAAGKALGNVGDGVSVQGSVGNMIGGVANGDGNTIRANQVGVNFVGAVAANLGAGNVVAGNTVDANLREGIRLFASSFNTIGDDAASNTITRNAGDGIALTIGSSANLVQGNTVGGATAADANKSAGIRVVGSNQNMLRNNTVSRNLANGIVVYGSGKTTIGGTAEDGNTIEANRGDGILLTDAATQTTILSNEVAANTGNGISVQRSTGNLIGTANAGNKVNANLLDGILVTSLSASTVIQANSIGGEAGANGANGIRVAGAFGTLIGGTLADDGNEIGANKAAGVAIATVASRTAAAATRVYGNTISNSNGVGIAVTGSTNQIIGGTASGQSNEFTANAVGIQIGGGSTGTLVTGNTIANSTLHGVSIVGSISNTISGNTINGSSGDGIRVTQAVAKSLATGNRIVNNILSDNTGAGVRLSASTQFTTIGAAGQRNVSNKNAVGVAIEGGSTNNLIDQNSIEANAVGIEINGSLTNVIRANTLAINGTGVSVINALAKSTAGGNQVVGNTIHESLGNGITIVGGGRHVIGGTAAGTANTITKSGSDGIAISVGTNGVGSVGNVIRGNYVGTNSVGTAGLGNAGGVSIAGGSGNDVSSGNVIRNNDGNGIAVSGSSLNTIGGSTAAAGNTISSNASNGVSLSAGSVGNLVAGNTISANTQAGVVVSDTSSQGNVIGLRVVGGSSSGRGNTISGNTGGGVAIDSALRNQIFANFLTGNTSGGTADQTAGIVLLDGGNGNAVTPTLSRVTFTRRALTITGTVPGAVKGSSYWIDAFSNGMVGEVQANQPVGRVLVRIGLNGAFTATVTLPTGVFLPAGTRITMTATDTFGNTSGISAPGTVA